MRELKPSLRLAVERSVGLACAIVGAFQVLRSESAPCGGTKYFFILHIVHAYRNAQHRAKRDDLRTDMPVADRAVIGAPVFHHGINVFERTFEGEIRRKPRSRPGFIRAFIYGVVDGFGDVYTVAFDQLKRRAQPSD